MGEGRGLADFEAADIEAGQLVVRGVVPAGCAVRLAVRRYKSLPDWAGVEVMSIEVGDGGSGDQRFVLSCEVERLWGREGIEVLGAATSVRFPRGDGSFL